MKKFILFTLILGLMCPSVFADNSAVFDDDGNIILNWETEYPGESLVVWITKDGETLFANMMNPEEYADGTLTIETDGMNDEDTVTVEYAGAAVYSESITFDKKAIAFDNLASEFEQASETETLETTMKYREFLNDETAEKLDNLKTDAEKTKMEEAIVNGEFANFAELEEIINDTYDEILKDRKDKENKKNNSSSSSGSSGGGGGGGSVSIPVTSVPVVPQPESKTEYDYEEPECDFDDMADVEWAEESIKKLYKKGVVSGKTEKTFAPNENVTRGQFLKMLVCAFEAQNDNAESSFADVPKTSWCYPYVSSAYESGLVNGISDEIFGVDENISRQDAAVMVYRFMKKYSTVFDGAKENAFSDKSEIAGYALEAVDYMSTNGIINGVGDGRFEPNGVCTRAMAAKIICAAAYGEE